MRGEGRALKPIFRSRHQATLLAWLLLHPEHEYTLTELAKRLDVLLTTGSGCSYAWGEDGCGLWLGAHAGVRPPSRGLHGGPSGGGPGLPVRSTMAS